MNDSPLPPFSPSERGTLNALAGGGDGPPLDWVAAQRLKQWGLIEDHPVMGFRITDAGRRHLRESQKLNGAD